MADEIIGCAILDRSTHLLYYLGRVLDNPMWRGIIHSGALPVKPANTPDPGPWIAGAEGYWHYTVSEDGERLNVSPSVMIRDFFHNTGQWSVKVVLSRAPGDTIRNQEDLWLLNPELRAEQDNWRAP